MRKRPNLTTATRIAFATSEPSCHQSPARWTELSVYYDPTPSVHSKPWIAIARGCTTVRGEQVREQFVQVGTLERALRLFDPDSTLGREVTVQAQDWAETEDKQIALPPAEAPSAPFASDDAALRYLFGDMLDAATPATLLSKIFGVGESSVRMQLKADKAVKITLRDAARFMDPAKLREAAVANG